MRAEHERGAAGRFGPGLPRISDGQLLFLLHMLAHAKDPKEGGSRIAIIMNGSPLFTGDAGSGESEIRRFILENDLLEALIALPEQLFYNTGIATYVWVVTNRKAPERQGKVQLIDATSFWVPMRKSLGDKRREIPLERAQDILKILADFKDGDTRASRRTARTRSRRQPDLPDDPLRLPQDHRRAPAPAQLPGEPERIARLEEEKGFQALAQSKKKGAAGAQGAGRRAGPAGGDPQAPARSPGHALQGPGRVRARARRRREEGRPEAPGSGQKGDPLGSLGARRDGRRSAATRTATPSPTRSCATPRACRC